MKLYLYALLILLIVSAELGSFSFPQKVSVTSGDHWGGTGLKWSDLYPSFSDEGCNTDKKSQLSCVLGIDSMARQLGWAVSLKDAKIFFSSLSDTAESRAEKETQIRWEKDLEKITHVILFSPSLEKLRKSVQGHKKEAAIVAAGLNGQLSIRYDPHSYLIPISQFEESLGDRQKASEGVGILIKKINNQIVVSKVIHSAQAEFLGVRRGDRLIAINGKPVLAKNIDLARRSLKGPKGSLVSLHFARGYREFEVKLQREVYSQMAVESKIVYQDQKPYGVLILNRFSTSACVQTRLALIGLIESSIEGVILDLRDNGGGQLDEAGCIAELFLKANSLVYSTEYFETHRQESYVTRLEPIYNGPLAVIINSNTASASEILAGAFQDYRRAVILGERSFGKGSFQSGRIWEQNPKIAFFKTQGLYYLPSGRSAQNSGVLPDIEVATLGPKSKREFDLYINPLLPVQIDLGNRIGLNLVCGAMEASRITSDIVDDRPIGKASQAIDCLKGSYGTHTF